MELVSTHGLAHVRQNRSRNFCSCKGTCGVLKRAEHSYSGNEQSMLATPGLLIRAVAQRLIQQLHPQTVLIPMKSNNRMK